MTRAQAGHLAMLAFSVLVAGSFSLGALAAPLIAASALSVARFALAGVLVGAVAALTVGLSRTHWQAPWRYGILGGLLGLYFVLMFEGLRTTSAVPMAAVFTLTPLMAAGFGWLILGQITTGRMALGLGLGAAGALWVIFRANLAALMRLDIGYGEVLYFLGCISHAIYAPMVRKLNRGEPVLIFTLGVMAAGGVLLLVYGWREVIGTDWVALPAIVWICILYVGVAASAITFVLLQYATLRLPSAKVMAYTYLVPTWVILWELALGHDAPPALVLIGVALTITALLLLLKDETPHP